MKHHLLLQPRNAAARHMWIEADEAPIAFLWNSTLWLEDEGQPSGECLPVRRYDEPDWCDRAAFPGATEAQLDPLTPDEIKAWRRNHRLPGEGEAPFCHMLRLLNASGNELYIWLHCQPHEFAIEKNGNHRGFRRESGNFEVPLYREVPGLTACALRKVRRVSQEYLHRFLNRTHHAA